MIPMPPTNAPYVDPKTGQVTEPWRRYQLSLDDTVVSGLAPIDARYWLSTGNDVLTNETNLGALASGYLKQTTVAGVATPSTVSTIPAADLTAGGTLPNLSGENLTGLNASNLASGTVPDARFPAVLPAVSGANLTDLPFTDAAYWISEADAGLSNAENLGALGTGYLRVTTAAGVATPSSVASIPVSDLTGAIPFSRLSTVDAASVLGRAAASVGVLAPIASSADGQVLQRSSGVLSFALPALIAKSGSLTTAQIRALNSAPVTIVAAQGSGQMIEPVAIAFKSVRSGTTFSVNGAVLLRWSGIATDLINSTTFGWNPNTAGSVYRVRHCIDATPADGSEPRNVALVLTAAADMTGGDGTTLLYDVLYRVVNFS